jgi:hypothetical protein
VPSRRTGVNAKKLNFGALVADLSCVMAMSHVLAGEIPARVTASRGLSIKARRVGNYTIDA